MDKVERAVQLPAGAEPLHNYARYYAFNKGGDIIGVYLLLIDQSSEACTEDDGKGGTRPTECFTVNWGNIKAGERLWVERESKLPMIFDGGCSVIRVTYVPWRNHVTEITCNGIA